MLAPLKRQIHVIQYRDGVLIHAHGHQGGEHHCHARLCSSVSLRRSLRHTQQVPLGWQFDTLVEHNQEGLGRHRTGVTRYM